MKDVQITRDGDIFACEYNGLEIQAGIYGNNGAYHIAAHVSGPYPNAVYGHCLPDSKPYARKGNAERAVARYIRDNAPALPEPDNTPEPDVTGHIQEPESSPYSDESEHEQVITCEQCGQHTAQWTYDFKASGSPAYHFFYTCQRDECGHTTSRLYERAPNTTPEPDNTPDKENVDMAEPDYNDAYHTCVSCDEVTYLDGWRLGMTESTRRYFWATCPHCGKEQQIDYPPEPRTDPQEPDGSPYSDASEHAPVIDCEQCGHHTAEWTYDYKAPGSPAYHFFYKCSRDECGHTTSKLYERIPEPPEPGNAPVCGTPEHGEPDNTRINVDGFLPDSPVCHDCGHAINQQAESLSVITGEHKEPEPGDIVVCEPCAIARRPQEPPAYRDSDGRILCPHCLYSFHGWNGTRECDALTTVQPGTICARCRKPLGEPEKTGDCGTPEQGEPDNTRIGADGKTPANKACFDCGRAIGYEAFSVITGKHKDIQPGDIILCEPCAIARDERAQGPTVTPELAANLASRICECIGWHEDTLKIQADKLSDYANRHAFGLSGDELADHNQQIEVCRMLARILRIARLAEYKPNR